MIDKFDSSDFFFEIDDSECLEPIGGIKITDIGLSLLIQYLNKKYNANICRITSEHPNSIYPDSVSECRPSLLTAIIELQRENYDKYRQVFIFKESETHYTFLAYIKENRQEAILFSDSIDSHARNIEFSRLFEELYNTTGIPVFFTQHQRGRSCIGRQASLKGCMVDAIVFARDITAYNIETQTYSRTPNLLEDLKKRQTINPDRPSMIHTKLPNVLLKTAQISTYVLENQNTFFLSAPIHKDETLESFRNRYRRAFPADPDFSTLIPGYLYLKSKKYCKIIEIQFYLNAIENEIGSSLSNDLKNSFIKQVKTIEDDSDGIYSFVLDFVDALHTNCGLAMTNI